MYLYEIKNLINDKKYIGITNDYKRRFREHCSKNKDSVISKAIKKYSKENFSFTVLKDGLSIEEACNLEIKFIKEQNTLVPNGYNVSKGGTANVGTSNGKAKLTEKEVQYIKDHRNIPMYVLYEDFNEKITYSTFKKVYNDETYKDIVPHVEQYKYNLEFTNQFTSNNKLTYGEIVDLREKYKNNIPWKEVYIKDGYNKIYKNELDFWNIYVGNRYKLVMPEVFTKERKHFQSSISHSGEQNGRAKLTKEDVLNIRALREKYKKTNSEIYKMYPQVSPVSIRYILNYKTWKNI